MSVVRYQKKNNQLVEEKKRWLRAKLEAVETSQQESVAVFNKKIQAITLKAVSAANALLEQPNEKITPKSVKICGQMLQECDNKLFDLLTSIYEEDTDVNSIFESDSVYQSPSSSDIVSLQYLRQKPDLDSIYTYGSPCINEKNEIRNKNQKAFEAVKANEESTSTKMEKFSVKDEQQNSQAFEAMIQKEKITITVSHCTSPSQFYVQNCKEEDNLIHFQVKLNEAYVKLSEDPNLKLSKPIVNRLYVSLFEWDMSWYRAKVISLRGSEEVEILFVDYGNTAIVPINLLRHIISRFEGESYFACECKLDKIAPDVDGTRWSDAALQWFNDFIFEKELQACFSLNDFENSPIESFKKISDSGKCYEVNLCYQAAPVDSAKDSLFSVSDTMVQLGFGIYQDKLEKANDSIFSNVCEVNRDILIPINNNRTNVLDQQYTDLNQTKADAYELFERLSKQSRERESFALHSQKGYESHCE